MNRFQRVTAYAFRTGAVLVLTILLLQLLTPDFPEPYRGILHWVGIALLALLLVLALASADSPTPPWVTRQTQAADSVASRVIHIEPTGEQWATIDELTAPGTPFVAAVTDEQGGPTGELWLERIIDDSEVRLYTVQPDGSYACEELSDGLHRGWTRYDEDGNEIDDDGGDDDE